MHQFCFLSDTHVFVRLLRLIKMHRTTTLISGYISINHCEGRTTYQLFSSKIHSHSITRCANAEAPYKKVSHVPFPFRWGRELKKRQVFYGEILMIMMMMVTVPVATYNECERQSKSANVPRQHYLNTDTPTTTHSYIHTLVRQTCMKKIYFSRKDFFLYCFGDIKVAHSKARYVMRIISLLGLLETSSLAVTPRYITLLTYAFTQDQ